MSLWNALHMGTLSTIPGITTRFYQLSRTPNEDKAITGDTRHYLFQLLIHTIKIMEDWKLLVPEILQI